MTTKALLMFLFFQVVQNEQCTNQQVKCVCSNSVIRRMEVEIGLKHLVEQGANTANKPYDCEEVYNKGHRSNGVYRIYPQGGKGYDVYCDMKTDGGGWTVIQRRFDGKENFYRTWQEYQVGFGSKNKEYWLGNEKILQLTQTNKYQLRVDLEDFKGVKKYAKYSIFSVGNNDTAYRLSIGGYEGTAGDSLAYHKKHKFATKDNDNKYGSAVKYKGAWWYTNGYYSNMNGMYMAGKTDVKSMNWYHFHRSHVSLKSCEMKIKQRY